MQFSALSVTPPCPKVSSTLPTTLECHGAVHRGRGGRESRGNLCGTNTILILSSSNTRFMCSVLAKRVGQVQNLPPESQLFFPMILRLSHFPKATEILM